MMAPTAALVATVGAVVSAVPAPSQVQMALAVPVEQAVPAVRDTTVSLEPAKTVQAAAMGVLAAWAVGCVLAFQYPGEHPPGAWVTYSSMANLNFLIGMGAWVLFHRGWGRGPMLGLGVLLVLGIPLAEGLGSATGPLVMALGFGALLAGMCGLEAEPPRWLRGMRWPRAWLAVGDASYSLYLLHLPLCGLLLKACAAGGWLALTTPAAPAAGHAALLVYALVLAAVIALSWLAYAAVERPLVAALQQRGPHQAKRPPEGGRLSVGCAGKI